MVSVQNRYNVTDRSSEPVLDLCEQEVLAFLPWAPIQEPRERGGAAAAERLRGQPAPGRAGLAAGQVTADPADPGLGLRRSTWRTNIAAAGLELSAEEVAAITKGG